VYIGAGYAYGPIFVSIVLALYWAVQAGRRREAVVVAAAGFAGFVVADIVDPFTDGVSWGAMSIIAGWMGVVLALSELARIKRHDIHERRRRAEAEVARRAEAERLAIAQDLHDVLAHNISLINVQSSVALHLVDEQPGQARSALANIKDASRDALRELRGALDLLQGGDAAPRGPAPTLDDVDQLVARLRVGGLDVDLRRAPLPELSTAVHLAGFRIVQEALTNVNRHAAARWARVTIGIDDGLRIEVVDDGVGVASDTNWDDESGRGLTGMRERAASVGGELEAGPGPHGGFRVAARLPVG
jgi:signal transduction histidine kinase